jgi:citrate lyase subunit beta / citryl-CoA lyase
MTARPFLRSFLFVPAANERLLTSATRKGSDAIILDLEDGMHPSLREEARATLASSIARVRAAGKAAAVRINGDWLSAIDDLRAAVVPGLDILVLPKVEHPRDVQIIAQMVTALETQRGISDSRTRFLLQIESAAALPRLHEIASASARAMGMMLGTEDFSLDCGALPTPEALLVPSLMVLQAARAAGLQPIGFVASIADLGSESEFRSVLARAHSLGFRGAVVVHPKFVQDVNDSFTPSTQEVANARRVVDAFESAFESGQGIARVDGLMVDKPVYLHALEVVKSSAEEPR